MRLLRQFIIAANEGNFRLRIVPMFSSERLSRRPPFI